MPKITSFQWWFANDRNAWQNGSFWNISGLEYRKNVGYMELSKGLITSVYDINTTNGIPVALTLWGNQWSAVRDIVTITNTGKVIDATGVQWTTPSWSAVNTFTRFGRNYILGINKIHLLASGSLNFFDPDIAIGAGTTFATNTDTRPVLNFNGDIFIGNGTNVARFNVWGTVIEWVSGTTQPVIGWLDGNVMALTNIWPNIYVWCNNGSDTVLYIWDWVTNRPSQSIRYTDKPVINVALLGNIHYWWSKKSDYSIRTINIGESYQPQTYIKTAFPRFPLLSNRFHEDNRMVIHIGIDSNINAIETLNDTVFLPWIGSIYSFGRYQPWVWTYSLAREIVFSGDYVRAMVSWWKTSTGNDFWGYLWFVHSHTTDNHHSVAVYNSGQYGGAWVFYRLAIRTIDCTATNGSNILLVNNTSQLTTSDPQTRVSWDGIHEWTYIVSLVLNTSVTLSANYTGTSGTVSVTFWDVWSYESMEFIASDMHKWEDDVKVTVPFYLPSSACSIKVYEKRDGGSYSLSKIINTTDYGVGFGVAEIASQWKWRTKQIKLILITTDSDFSPRVYVWINNYTKETWKLTA